jgi:two-component system CheB/CheR fusion protein
MVLHLIPADGAAERYNGSRRMAIRPPGSEAPADSARSIEDAFETGQLPQVLVDSDGTVTYVNERARALFGLTDADIRMPIDDLEIAHGQIDLRSLIDQSIRDGRPTAAQRVEWVRDQESAFVDVHAVPLVSPTGAVLGTGITFLDVTGFHELEEQLRRSQHEVERAYEELRSTVEELATTNEELRSTNEELETMHDELRSTNQELETLAEELRRRSLEPDGGTSSSSRS